MTTFEDHLRLATAQHATLLFLCLCGLLLNSLMLFIFFAKKQIRGSIYTTYMIQIAVTDLMVCMVWIVISSIYLTDLPRNGNIQDIKTELQIDSEVAPENKNILLYRFTFAVYYFHYYNNIFLLATMSVERCVAVWKSLRCQRYQFNRKFIYGVSVTMWILAFSCALPSFVNPDLITQGEQINPLSRSDKTIVLSKCAEPFEYAVNHNLSYVMDYNDVSWMDCMKMMKRYNFQYYFKNNTSDSTMEEQQEESTIDEPSKSDIIYTLSLNDATYLVINRDIYGLLLKMMLEIIGNISEDNDLDALCDPGLSHDAKIYHVLVNLTLGFLLPFLAIVLSYSAIAYLIGKRAKVRLKSDATEDATMRRRTSDVFKQIRKNFNKKSNAQNTGNTTASSSSLQEQKQTMKESHCDLINDNNNLLNKTLKTSDKSATTAITIQQASPSRGQRSSYGNATSWLNDPMKKDVHLMPSQIRRISGGSTSCMESFPTDNTSLQTTNPNSELGKNLDSTNYCANNYKNGQDCIVPSLPTCSADVSVIKLCRGNKKNNLVETDQEKRISMASPCVEDPSAELTQELLESKYSRRYTPAPIKSSSQHNPSTFRNRAPSAASYRSTSGGTLRKSVVHKNAQRQLRVSRTVIAYVVAFALCWLPQRIATVVYVTEALVNMSGFQCHLVVQITRIFSFFSVLLNPIVYGVTQKEVRQYVRHSLLRLCKCICPRWQSDKLAPIKATADVRRTRASSRENYTVYNVIGARFARNSSRKNRETRSIPLLNLIQKNTRGGRTGAIPTNRVDKYCDEKKRKRTNL